MTTRVATMLVPGGQAFGAALIAAGAGSFSYGSGEVIDSMVHVNPVKNFVIDNLGISESDYELFGGMLTTASSFGIGVATMMAKPHVQVSATGVGTVSSRSSNSKYNNQTIIEPTETQKNYRANMAQVNARRTEGVHKLITHMKELSKHLII